MEGTGRSLTPPGGASKVGCTHGLFGEITQWGILKRIRLYGSPGRTPPHRQVPGGVEPPAEYEMRGSKTVSAQRPIADRELAELEA